MDKTKTAVSVDLCIVSSLKWVESLTGSISYHIIEELWTY